jgi:sugar phosphate isomerase/epimerase
MMLDVKSMCSEGRRPEEIIRSMSGRFSHFHANDANMRAPGTGDVDFVPIMEALIASEYSDHVSVEVFDYSPDPVTIAEQSIRYMKACLELARSS